MKKTLSTMLIGSMLLMPLPVLATDDDNYIHSLSFEKIEDEMKARSSLVIEAGDKVAEAQSKIDDSLDDLKNIKEGMEKNPEAPAGYKVGMTTKDPSLVPPTPPTFDEDNTYSENDELLLNYIVSQFKYQTLYNYVSQIETLEKQIKQLEDSDDDMWKSWLQVEQGREQIIWQAQQLYLSYFNFEKTRDNLQTSLTLLQKKLVALQLKESLGLATHIEILESESDIKELTLSIDSLKEGLEAIKGQMNVMLGQDFDTELTFSEPSSVSQSKLSEMDYEEDLDNAIDQSYSVRLEEESDQREDAERNFTLAFHKAYQSVQDKKKALELERYKLSNEQLKYDQAVLMNSLGLTSTLDFEGLRSLYLTQVNKVKTAEQDVLQAYTAYDWMKKGLTVSTGASASGASSSSSSASSSQASGAAPSGMGF